MPSPSNSPPSPDDPTQPFDQDGKAQELVAILDQYLADLQAGKQPDRARLLADHPELASQLTDCLTGLEFIHRTAQPGSDAPAQLGEFRIVREVGRGGMGVVYEAEQLSLKGKVALKVLRFGVSTDEQVMQCFHARRKPSRTCITRISSPFMPSVAIAASTITRCSSSQDGVLPRWPKNARESRPAATTSGESPPGSCKAPKPWPTPISAALSIGISSPRI